MGRIMALLAVLPCCAGYLLSHAPSRGAPPGHRRARQPRATATSENLGVDVPAPPPIDELQELVRAATCASCEQEWIEKSKTTESAERIRLDDLRKQDITNYINEVWEYGMRMNDTQRQELALNPDTELRNFIISSSTAPTPLLEHVYNSTMQRVPYEQVHTRCRPH